MRAWLGFDPMPLPKGAIGFHWTEKGGVRTPLRVAKLSEMPAPPAGTQIVTAAGRTAAAPRGAENGERTKSATT